MHNVKDKNACATNEPLFTEVSSLRTHLHNGNSALLSVLGRVVGSGRVALPRLGLHSPEALRSTSFWICRSCRKPTLTSSVRRDRKGNCWTFKSLNGQGFPLLFSSILRFIPHGFIWMGFP